MVTFVVASLVYIYIISIKLFVCIGRTRALRDVGIAGMHCFHGVKCLHTHYAHYRAFPHHGNLIGQWVQELIDDNEIEDDDPSRSLELKLVHTVEGKLR